MPRPTVTRLMEQACNDRGTACCPQRPAQLLMVGRLAPQKDQATALAALAQLRDRDWRLRIVGQGPLRAQLEAQCARLGLSDRVEFLGFVDCPHRMASLFAEADLLLQPSCWEGLAGTMIEALGCGAGVVATDCTRNIHPLLAAAASIRRCRSAMSMALPARSSGRWSIRRRPRNWRRRCANMGWTGRWTPICAR
ncbi:glycosyltransferase [Sphingobium scionense]